MLKVSIEQKIYAKAKSACGSVEMKGDTTQRLSTGDGLPSEFRVIRSYRQNELTLRDTIKIDFALENVFYLVY